MLTHASPKSETALGDEQVFVKLGKSIVAKEVISKGEEFTLDNLGGLILTKHCPCERDWEISWKNIKIRNLKK